MKKVLLLVIFVIAGWLLWAFPFFSVALSAPTQDEFELVKSDSLDPVIAGNMLTYTLSVTNTSGMQATGVVLTDIFPDGVSFNDASPGCIYIDPGSVECNLGSMPGGDSATRWIIVRVDPSARGSITNTAVVSSHQITSTITVSETTNIYASAELGIAKSDGIDQVIAGDGVVRSYTIDVTNAGPSDASNVLITDTWPSGFVRGTVSHSAGGSCDTTTSPTNFTCTYASIPVGGSATITANYSVPPDTAEGPHTNTVQASSVDANATVSANDVNMVVNDAQLGISKSDGVVQVTAGDGVTHAYAITVTNTGPSLASGVVVTDTWPAGFTRGVVDVSSPGVCDTQTSQMNFTCDLGDIPVGSQRTITATYSVPPGTQEGTQTNTVEADSVDAGAPVTASDANLVVNSANLSISKSDTVAQVIAGDDVVRTYTINVTNAGPSDASGVVITDIWPAGFVRGTVNHSAGGTCDTTTSPTNFTCTFTSIPADGSATVTANYSVPPDTQAGTQTNTVQASSVDASATVSANDVNNVTTQADLSLVKLDNPDPVHSGEIVTYTLTVTNLGPSNAAEVVVTDNLPTDTTYLDSVSSVECDSSGLHTVICHLEGIASGSNKQVVIRAQVTKTTPGQINNQASVTAVTSDPNAGNNQANTVTSVDVGNPVVNWTGPVPNEGYLYVGCQPDCPTVHLDASAIDDAGVYRVNFYRWDHVNIAFVDIGSDYNYPYTWEFDTSVLPAGYNQIFVRAYDYVGHQSLRKRIFLYKWVIYLPVVSK